MTGTDGFGHNGSRITQEEQIAAQAAHMQQGLDELSAQVTAGFAELARNGIQFDPGQVINARIDMLIQSVGEAFGPQGQLWALQAKISFLQKISEQQQNACEQGTTVQLSLGGKFTPAMIRQLAAETGFLKGS